MADKEISGLTAAAALDGSELVHVSQGGNSRKATATQVKTFAQTGLGTAAALSLAEVDERARDAVGIALVAGTNIVVTPNDGADTITISTTGLYTSTSVDALIATVAVGNQGQTPNGVVSGCGIVYSGAALTFDMAAGTFNLNGVLITAAAQSITLAAADATNPRIDVIYLDDTGTIGKITGTAAASPSQPTVDPTSQLFLTFVQIPATATTIAGITNENIYLEDTEWPSTVIGSGVTKASTTNPYAGTKDVEFTNTPATSGIKFVRSSAMSFDGDGNLTFRIRSKATWITKRWLTFQWYLAGVAKGSPVVLKSGTFGFDSSVTSGYQLAIISKLQFAISSGTTIDELRVLDVGGAIGLYLDNIILQTNGTSAGGAGTNGITQAQADARYALRLPQIQSVTSAATVTPVFGNDQVNITAQAAGLTLANPTGSPIDGWGMVVRIKDNGTARAIAYGGQYRAIGVTLPTTTVISKTLYLAMEYNAADTKWDVVAVAQEA